MKTSWVKKYTQNSGGLVTTEFAVLSFSLFLIIFFVVELTLLYFFIQSAQKAAQMGARVAIVSDSAAAGLPADNALASGGIFGTACNSVSSPCVDFGTLTCTGNGGTGCNTDSLNRIVARMQNFLPGLEAAHVTISYAYQGLGYAGGPVIPAVTVTIAGVPYQAGILGILLGAAGGPIDVVPAVSATLTGEDMSNNGA